MDIAQLDHWEAVSQTAWGRYISALEEAAIRTAAAATAAVAVPRRAVDLGCGGGRWTRLLLDSGFSVVATDVDAAAVETCAQRNPAAECLLVPPAAESVPLAAGSTGLLVCIEVVAATHAPWFADEVARVLVPGGRLVTVVWNRESARGAVAGGAAQLRGRRHPYYTTSYRSWRRNLLDAGLHIEAERGLCWFPFSRASDSRWIPAFTALERLVGLDRMPSVSPWVLVTARKDRSDDC